MIFYAGTFLTCLPVSFCLSACTKSEPKIEENWIAFPENLSYTQTLDEKRESYHVIPGFKYNGPLEFNRLKVTSSFNISDGIIEVSIIDWNSQTKSFSVSIATKDVSFGSYSGILEFKYDGLDIIVIGDYNIQMNLLDYRQISSPENDTDTKQLDLNGNADFKFSNFSYTGLDDIANKLEVRSEYEIQGSTITTELEPLDNNKFNVYIHVQNGKPRLLRGRLYFYYDEQLLTNSPQNDFTINLLEPTNIIEPKNKHVKIINDIYGKAIVTFAGFTYSGLNPNDLTVTSTFESSITAASYSCNIVNIDPLSHLFDVQIILKDCPHIDNVHGSFAFKLGDQTFTTSDDFSISVRTSISSTYLDVSPNAEGKISLNGLKDGVDVSDYDTLLVPRFVQVIADNALSDKGIQGLDFEDNPALEQIGDHSFANCTHLNSVTIPSSVTDIGTSAFQGSISIQSLTFEEGSAPLTIRSHAFALENDTKSKWKISLPKRTALVESLAFSRVTANELYIPSEVKKIGVSAFNAMLWLDTIYINDPADKLPDWMTNYSESDGVFVDAGYELDESKIKRVYIPNSESIDKDEAERILFDVLELPKNIHWEVAKK